MIFVHGGGERRSSSNPTRSPLQGEGDGGLRWSVEWRVAESESRVDSVGSGAALVVVEELQAGRGGFLGYPDIGCKSYVKCDSKILFVS